MFAYFFVIGLILCVPAAPASEIFAVSLGWESVTATRWESATRWLLMSGAAIIAITLMVALAPWARGRKEAGYGLVLGAIVGSAAIWGLYLCGP
jgi:hypothetical protein